ncbi:heavy-metal-associated domain-containing protein [Campylobacter sp. RKI_CA19_01116]|uniref:heavy-metal-associated domain-containing protein n=1 Tax=Campylobacter sp. RKI_CA19_01116 TaxID=2911625 RepID=UPI0017F4DD2D|nr:heavy metal-associated domain-containing protein [Campylobacter sp. RKI_CA19_01116]EAH6868266.1 heavy-metal-associated domain-containing protein [Campylobacter lari]MCV3396897.1 heavy-metal-associated domain-containing protein [Campylobacter sp. RKI_CA19_01116]HEC1769542.1 heavy-metal-associated domain-containing protein [Campylobacter lari]
MIIKTKNINCQSCVNLIKASLEDKFGAMQINVETKSIEIDLKAEQVEEFKKQLQDLGFEIDEA